MDFFNYNCPVCDKRFVQGDDIVVCPECGTPHHRECYEDNGHCFYEAKHSDDFSFEAETNNTKTETASEEFVICPHCHTENEKTMFYCQKCGFPLLNNNPDPSNSQNEQNQSPFNGMPQNGFPDFAGTPFIMVDPMAGFKSEDKINENVTAGELSKFVGKNTNYFMRIFGNILRTNKSRFNFSAFLFSGAYFLYRKMYALGIFLSILMIGFNVGTVFIQNTSEYQTIYELYFENYSSAMSSARYDISALFTGMTDNEIFFFFIPIILEFLKYAIMFICGFIANRAYYKHCLKKISKIKKHAASFDKVSDTVTENETKSKISEEIELKGGVNLAIAMSTAFIYIAVAYIPLFL